MQEAMCQFSIFDFFIAAFAKLHGFTVSPLISSINISKRIFCTFFLFLFFLLYVNLALNRSDINPTWKKDPLMPSLRCVIAKSHQIADIIFSDEYNIGYLKQLDITFSDELSWLTLNYIISGWFWTTIYLNNL